VVSLAVLFLLRWPVDDVNRTISAYYDHGGVVDWACGGNTYSGHKGTDIAVPRHTQVYAAADGWVKQSADGYGDGYLGNTDGGGFGNHVALYHGNGEETIYGHMSAGSGIPLAGETIGCGAPIGQSGTSGSSTGPHLHFETRVGVDENGSYYSGDADDPYAGECGGPISYWRDQAGDRPVAACATVPPEPQVDGGVETPGVDGGGGGGGDDDAPEVGDGTGGCSAGGSPGVLAILALASLAAGRRSRRA
jgi:murein DD-endopeptidase MepM/ murein hydrolase activator NlpD